VHIISYYNLLPAVASTAQQRVTFSVKSLSEHMLLLEDHFSRTLHIWTVCVI